MKATIQDAKIALKRPHNAILLALAFCLSAGAIYFVGYIQWRRFVIPILILISASLTYRIGKKRLRESDMSNVVQTAGKGLLVLALTMVAGAFIDNTFFADTPQVVFVIMTAMWVWIAFQMARLDRRLVKLSPEDIAVITENSDVVMARLKDREIKMTAAIVNYDLVREKYGLSKSGSLIVH